MPVPTRSTASWDQDTYSLLSQETTATSMTIGDIFPSVLVRQTARKGFTFNIMSVGPQGLEKTTILSALFGKNLEITREKIQDMPIKDPLNPPITIDSKTFDIDEKRFRLKLTVVDCKNYGEALCLKDSHKPLVDYVDQQFDNYYSLESKGERPRQRSDTMIHCLFFFVSAIERGLSELDLEFLRAIHNRVNVVPIIARADALTASEKASFKQRLKDDLKRNNISVYQMMGPDSEDTDDMKKVFTEIQDALPFAISSMTRVTAPQADGSPKKDSPDPNNRDHSDFLLLKTMIHTQMLDLCEITREVFYEEYRKTRIRAENHNNSKRIVSRS